MPLPPPPTPMLKVQSGKHAMLRSGLPSSVTSQNVFSSFKKALKTHLYQLAHDT